MEEAGESVCQGGGGFARHHGVADAQPLDVAGEHLCPLLIDFIAHQQPLTLHPPCNLGGFSAGGGAQIQDDFPWLRIQQGGGSHGAGFLQIVDTGFVIGVQAGAAVRVIVIAHGLPGHRLSHKGQYRDGTLQGVKPQGNGTGALKGAQVLVIFVSQLLLHPGKKFFRKHR